MKILFLASWYPTDKNPNFGVFIKEHAYAIKKAGNDIVVLALVIHKDKKHYAFSVTDFIDDEGVKTVLIEINTKYSNYLNHIISFQFFLINKYFKKLIQPDFQPDIIHSNVIFPSGILGHKLSKSLGKPHVITEHWSRIKGFLQKPVFGKMATRSYLAADAIFPVSEFLKKNLLTLIPALDSDKIIPVPNIIDTTIFNFKTKVPSKDTIRFCAVATWANKKIPDKIPEFFIEALGQISIENNRKIQLTMIGGGDKIQELKEMCLINNIDAIFTGYQDKTEIAKHLKAADFFVHASTIETFGVVVAEALMCGTPVICSKVGALPELINEFNGIMCENTHDSWVQAINNAMNTDFDYQLISQNIQDDFSLIGIGNKISLIYTNIIL
ncbi:MAG: glycosyltransferase [Paludibacter sp.]|nr:glycosyltransferase [Paludibacter sp.]